MTRFSKALSILILAGLILLIAASIFRPWVIGATMPPKPDRPVIVKAVLDGAVTPAMSQFVARVIDRAEARKAEAVLFLLDTPGGLVESMRGVNKEILASEVPVIVYVAPQGARAASAGVFITMAGHVAAMAPGTNIGAAHPVGAGGKDVPGEMAKKVTNDMIAYARSIADRRKRNADWAERAVRHSVSLPALEAAQENVIDVVAPNIEALLEFAHGRQVELARGGYVLRTKKARVVDFEPTFRDKILTTIANPNLAYLLLMLGMLGLYLELSHPGLILPGTVGAISLILAFFAMQTLSVSLAGLLLIIVGVVLFIMELWVTSYGLLSIGGVGCLFVGSVMLFENPGTAFGLSWSVILTVVGTISAFFVIIIYLVVKAQRGRPTGGAQGMLGRIGEVLEWSGEEGKVFIRGEIWRARSPIPMNPGNKIEVISQEGLVLFIEAVPEED